MNYVSLPNDEPNDLQTLNLNYKVTLNAELNTEI